MSNEAEIFTVLGNYLPLLVFLLITVVVYAVLAKTKVLGDKIFIQMAVAFLTAMILVTFSKVRTYLAEIAPWFAVFVFMIFSVLILMAFIGKDIDVIKKGVGIFFVIMFVIFLIVLFYYGFLKGNIDYGKFLAWLGNARVYGALMLLVFGSATAFILVKAK